MITIADNEKEFDNLAAWLVIEQILGKPKSVIGLSTGRTTGNLHRIIGEIYSQRHFPVEDVTFFGVDEVVNVPREYAGSCYSILKTELIDALGIADDNFLMLPTVSANFRKACSDFQNELDRRGGIDLLILGLGENGHLGFNQPGGSFDSETRVTNMHADLERRIRREANVLPEKPLGGVTLGIKNIMQARRIVLVAKGAHKADAVRDMLEKPMSTDVPASILQLHPCCEFLLDKQAASKLGASMLSHLHHS